VPISPTLFAYQAEPAAPPADGAAKQAAPSPFGVGGPFFILAVFALLYFVIILPMNRRQRKEQEQTLASIKRGTKIATGSGIIGVVVTADEGKDEIVIRSEDTKLRILRSSVSKVLGQDE
jgi:preprotein translocase subunit YajC